MIKRLIIGTGLAVALMATGAWGQTQGPQHQCTPTEAVANTVAEEDAGQLETDKAMLAALEKMSAINAKAKLPNVAIKNQLSVADLMRFQQARAEMIKIGMFRSAESRNTRDMRLLDELARYAEIVDLDHFDMTAVKDTDPRHFYFLMIGALREVQPQPPETVLPDASGGCTMEAALSLIEHFHMSQMAHDPTNKGSLDLILDARRLSQLLSIMRKARELDEQDVARMRLDANGDPQALDDAFTKWLTTQPKSSQQMGDVLLKAIDNTFPSKSHYELEHQSAQTAQSNAEFGAAMKNAK